MRLEKTNPAPGHPSEQGRLSARWTIAGLPGLYLERSRWSCLLHQDSWRVALWWAEEEWEDSPRYSREESIFYLLQGQRFETRTKLLDAIQAALTLLEQSTPREVPF